jgi:hypothetical protein
MRPWARESFARSVGLCLAIVVAGVGFAAAQRPQGADRSRHTGIIDFALELKAPSLAALRASADAEVPGRLSTGGGRKAANVLVRLKGQQGSKRSIDDKPALKITVLGGATVLGAVNLTLNNMVQDPTMLHEAIGYRVYATAGVMVPDTRFARLSINGQARGLYLLVDTIDRRFLARRFGNGTGILYEGAYGTDLSPAAARRFELDEGRDPNRAQLMRLIRAVAEPGDGVFFGPKALVDTRSFVRMMAVQVLIADWDNYYKANNYRIYWNPAAGRWFFIPTGIDQTFSTTRPVTAFGARGVLFVKCLQSKRCTNEYTAALREVADQFERLNLTAEMDRLLSVIGEASASDPKKPYSTATMKASRSAMRQFIVNRPGIVRKDLAARGPEAVPRSAATRSES